DVLRVHIFRERQVAHVRHAIGRGRAQRRRNDAFHHASDAEQREAVLELHVHADGNARALPASGPGVWLRAEKGVKRIATRSSSGRKYHESVYEGGMPCASSCALNFAYRSMTSSRNPPPAGLTSASRPSRLIDR